MAFDEQIAQEVAEIYSWIDEQIERKRIIRLCESCGKCCDFSRFDHRLFITTAELIYFRSKIPIDNIRTMTTNVCPYLEDSKCTIHPFRFAGCRIFFCKAQREPQSQIAEQVLKKLKSICENYRIAYRYVELRKALNDTLRS